MGIREDQVCVSEDWVGARCVAISSASVYSRAVLREPHFRYPVGARGRLCHIDRSKRKQPAAAATPPMCFGTKQLGDGMLRWQVFPAIIGRQKDNRARNCGGSETEKATKQKLNPPGPGTDTMTGRCVWSKPQVWDGKANEGIRINFGLYCVTEFSLVRL